MKNNVSFIMIDTGSQSNIIMMSDIRKLENSYQMSEIYHISNPLLKKLYKVHFSYRLNTKLNLPFKKIWNKYCVLDNMTKDPGTDYYIIFVNNSVQKTDAAYINQLSKKKNVHFILLLLDSYHDLSDNLKRQINAVSFENIFSFQKSDCDKYGFIYTNTIYSRAEDVKLNRSFTSDLYFLGADKGRMEQIFSLYQQAVSNDLVCDFTVVVPKGKANEYKKRYPGIKILSDRVDYLTILDGISQTRCILELCQKGQDGLTMRFYEAVFYNKKLLTNNVTALHHPMYNSKYMRLIVDDNTVDIGFLKNKETVDYQYHDEMSPVHFAEKILEVSRNDRN